jgi:hypothetical protein
VNYTVQDFTIVASPTSVTVNAGVAGVSTITVKALDGFDGTVALTYSVLPSTGLTCTLSPTNIPGSGTSSLSCSGSAGTYTVTIVATSSSLSHVATVTYTGHDFSITASPTTVNIAVGASTTSTITVTAVNGFNGIVGLTPTVSPSTGLSCALSTTNVTGSGTSTLSCTSSLSGNYTTTIVGASGSLTHAAALSISVNKASPLLTANLSDYTILVGNSVSISSGMSGGFEPSGTVTYEYVEGSSCLGTSPKTIAPTVTISGGVVPSSISQIFDSAGRYSLYASYEGDQNNAATTSNCMLLTVTPTLSAPTSLTVTAGSTVHFMVNATDPDFTQPIQLSVNTRPSGASFASSQSSSIVSSSFTWTPTMAGDYNVTFTAEAGGVTTSLEVTIHVNAAAKTAPLPILQYSIFGVVGFLVVLIAAVILRRFQNPRRKLNR